MAMSLTVSKSQARRFLLRHHHLLPHPHLKLDGVNAAFQYFRLLQHDPLNPCGRNIDLVLQSRLSDYKVGDFATWLYQERKGIEGFDKVMCVVPREDYRYLRLMAKLNAKSGERHHFLMEHRAELNTLIASIRANGPVSSRDLLDERRLPIGWKDNHWGAVALETLWRSGELLICHRQGNQRYYDVPERVLGDVDTTEPSLVEHIKRRLGAVGMLPLSGGGTGWLGAGGAGVLQPELKRMLATGDLHSVQVEGVSTTFVVRAEDMDILHADIELAEPYAMRIIAPLDNLLWDRRMIGQLFDFDYKWEVCTPAAARKYGYYVLPLLYGEHLVGRIEPVVKNGALEIRGKWVEESVTWDTAMEQALETCQQRFRQYLGLL